MTNNAISRPLLVVGESFPPFEFIQNDEVVGIDIDIAQHIFAQLEIPVEFKLFAWKRAWFMVENGQADAVLSTSWETYRDTYLWFPKEPMWVSEFVFFVNKKNKQSDFNGYDTIFTQNLRVGIIRGNSYHPSFWQQFPYPDGSTQFKGDMAKVWHPQLLLSRDLKTNLKMLAAGWIDLHPTDKIMGAYTAKLLKLDKKLTYYDDVLFSKPYPMPFAKKSTYPDIKNIAKRYEAALIEFKESAAYKAILDKWLN